jgi:sulfur carrier protein
VTVIVNGDPVQVDRDATVAGVLARLGHQRERGGIAVALNGAVVPRSAWEQTRLAERDRLEVLGATQGG